MAAVPLTAGYDDVTGIGTPASTFVTAFGNL
jgi:hypothetical protein